MTNLKIRKFLQIFFWIESWIFKSKTWNNYWTEIILIAWWSSTEREYFSRKCRKALTIRVWSKFSIHSKLCKNWKSFLLQILQQLCFKRFYGEKDGLVSRKLFLNSSLIVFKLKTGLNNYNNVSSYWICSFVLKYPEDALKINVKHFGF